MKAKHIFTFFLIISFCITSIHSFSQEKKKVLEISTSSFDQFIIKYKFGNKKHLFRLSTGYLNGSSSDYSVSDINDINSGFGIGFGIEFPRNLNDRLILYYGPELRTNFYNTTGSNEEIQYGAGVYGILGIACYLNNTIRLGAEISPGIRYDYYRDKNNNNYTSKIFRYGFSNSGAELVLGFEF